MDLEWELNGGNWQKQRSRAWKASAQLGKQVGVGGSKHWQSQGFSGCGGHSLNTGTWQHRQRMTVCSELGFRQDAFLLWAPGRLGRLCKGPTGVGRQKVAW